MNHTEKTIPVWKKYSLNVSEAAEYYGIGEKRLRQIAGENEGADSAIKTRGWPTRRVIFFFNLGANLQMQMSKIKI